jgi:hypothetical protein
MNNMLKEYIQQVIREATNASQEKPFGNHLFGWARDIPEEDTKEEWQIYYNLKNFVRSYKQKPDLIKQAQYLLSLMDNGKYNDVLKPKEGIVYRGMAFGKRNYTEIESLFGDTSFSEITTEQPFISKDSFVYSPLDSKPLSSWSYDFNIAFDFSRQRNPVELSIGVIMSAVVPSGGNFVLNHEEVPIMKSMKESEVVSLGDVKCMKTIIIPFEQVFEQVLGSPKFIGKSDYNTIKKIITPYFA